MRATPPAPPADAAESTRLRLTFLSLLVVSLFVLLFARLWFLQVMAGERYADLAQGNAVRTIPIEAPRGKILDRDGEPLVANRFALVVAVRPDEMGERREEVLADLADLLGLDVAEVNERIEASRVTPFRPKPIAVDVPQDIVFYINENKSTRYPGVYAEALPLRTYPKDALGAHLAGFLGEISPDELDDERYAGYKPGDLIGWAGVERSHERVLRGREGRRLLEVNAQGQVLRMLEEEPPVPGADVHLAVDLDAQRLAEEALAAGLEQARKTRDRESGPGRGGTFAAPAGGVVVLDPRTGEVVAMASHPTFDPARFVGGVSQDYWDWLTDPDNDYPLINRIVQSSYPPGSVFKVVSAAAALEHGYMTANSQLPCPGAWEWNGSVYRNWRRRDSPPMTIAESLTESCDTVYYELARRMWSDEQANGAETEYLTEQALAWGFGQRHGVDLPGEGGGVVPGRRWREEFWQNHRDTYCMQAERAEPDSWAKELYTELCSEVGKRWRGGDAVNMSIGQGDVQTTPLQVATAFAAIANGGTLYRPHVAEAIHHRDGSVVEVEPEVIGSLPVSAAHLAVIEQGLRGVTAEGGTAGSVFANFPLPVAGKTGTAEMKPKQPFAWFAAYIPEVIDGRQYVVVAAVEEGGAGSQTAAPIARRVLEGLFGLNETPVQPGVPTD